jgi:elongation factor 1-gamma
MNPKLLTYPGDFRAFKGLIAAQYANISVDTDAKFKMGESNTTKEFKKLSPLGKVPLLVTEDGPLLESNSIARYFARQAPTKNLMGTSFFQQAQVDSWLDWCSNELELPVTMWIFPIFGFMPPNPKAVNKAKKDTAEALKVLEAHLLNHSYLVGEAITLADIVLVSSLVYPMTMVFDASFRKNFPCVTRWFLTCVAQKEFSNVVGDTVLCTKAMELPKPVKKDKKKKAKEPAKKADKPKPKPKKAPRKKHPLDSLEKSTFVLDAWKKKYSNSKTLAKLYSSFDDWFLENFDAEGWSLWEACKKVNEDPTAPENVKDDDWKVSNAVGGLVSRFDEIRKWSFGVFHILNNYDERKRYSIEGLMILRGQDHKFFDCNPEYNLYNFRKLDLAKDADKKRARDLICGWDNCGDVPIYDSKVFK